MDLSDLNKILSFESFYRLKQAKKAVFQDLIVDWKDASILPISLREKLNKACPLQINGCLFPSKDQKSFKALITLIDGLKIESVLMRHKDKRNTVCVSCQCGCSLACTFCATGKLGFKRNLSVYEIVEQVLFFARFLKKNGEKITNVVFMGMGEPFLNYESMLSAIRVLNDRDCFNLGARHISISTVGITEGIKKLAEENLEVNLAISLHAPFDNLRSKLMPINKKYPLVKVLEAVDLYIKKTRRRVMFEYIMIKDVNDSLKHAEKLAKILQGRLCFVNLISYNPIRDAINRVSTISSFKIKKFKEILEKNGISVTERYRFGRDIKAACGQLAGGCRQELA